MDEVAAVLRVWSLAGAHPTATDTPAALQRLLSHEPDALIVAESDGQLIGTLIAAWDGWRGSFHRLAVLPQHRREGVARRLLSEGARRLRARGATRLTAIVVADDVAAMAFWRSEGYEEQARRARFVTNR
ncbi:MAG TPA: GNAT family N-acetyltransferase [Candidatus Dormibacteraeota bacterium]